MIIEVDEKTGQAKTYNSISEFVFTHRDVLDPIFKKKFAPTIEFAMWNKELLEKQLPAGTGHIISVISHSGHIVCKCESGVIYSFSRTGTYPYFEIDIKPWQK